MRTKTIEFNVYDFDDVMNNEELKQKVLEKHYYINVDYDGWHDFIIEGWEKKLNNYGFDEVEINFTGFYSQGDGASFTSKNIDIEQLAKTINNQFSNTFKNRDIKVLKALYEQGYIYGDIERTDWHYYHENSTTLNVYTGQMYANWVRLEKIVNNFDKMASQFIYELNQQIYEDLKKQYEYLTSEDAIFEMLQTNEYEFDEDGNIV